MALFKDTTLMGQSANLRILKKDLSALVYWCAYFKNKKNKRKVAQLEQRISDIRSQISDINRRLDRRYAFIRRD